MEKLLSDSLGAEGLNCSRQRLAACLAGDRAQVGELVNLYRPYLMAIAQGEWRGELRAKEGVSDLVQESIIKGVEAFDYFRGSTEAEFAGWLRQILLHRVQNAVRHYRTSKRRMDLEEPLASHERVHGSATPSALVVSSETREKLLVAIDLLPQDYTIVVRLRQFENLNWDEIAIRMQRSPEAARKLWARAIAELRKNLDLQAYADSTIKSVESRS